MLNSPDWREPKPLPTNLELVTLSDGHATIECASVGATGSPIVGRGVSMLEAIGEWCLYTGLVQIEPKNNAVALGRYRVDPSRSTVYTKKPRSRGD